MLRLYDTGTGRVEEITSTRPGVVRVSCHGGLRTLVVGDVIRRLLGHHRLRTIGIWDDVPGAADLNVRPAELTPAEAGAKNGPAADGDAADVRIGDTVASSTPPALDDLDPLAARLAMLARHYRADVELDRAALAEAESTLVRLRRTVATWADAPGRPPVAAYVDEAVEALDADLDSPAVFALLDRLAQDASTPPGAKFETVIRLDMILGLDLVRLVGRI